MFETKYKLRRHIRVVHDENLSNVRFVTKYLKFFKCEICNEVFERKLKFWKHIKIVHDENFLNVRFVMKYFKENMNREGIFEC